MFEEHEGTHILQSLDGFAISLNSDGRFLYISETVSTFSSSSVSVSLSNIVSLKNGKTPLNFSLPTNLVK